MLLEDFRQAGGKMSLEARDNTTIFAMDVAIQSTFRLIAYCLDSNMRIDVLQDEYVMDIQDSKWSSEHFRMTGNSFYSYK
jgi:hypothetical protein